MFLNNCNKKSERVIHFYVPVCFFCVKILLVLEVNKTGSFRIFVPFSRRLKTALLRDPIDPITLVRDFLDFTLEILFTYKIFM